MKAPPTQCPRCGHEINMADNMNEEVDPSSGEFSICFYCVEVNVFSNDLTLRLPTKLEEIEIMMHDDLQEARRLLKNIKKHLQ
jgi:hypothetical protein